MNTGQLCADKGIPAGSHFYYACLYQPQASRLHPLLALHNELSTLIFQSTDPGAARLSLAWWGDELMRLQQGRAHHPITRLLQQHDMTLDHHAFISSLHACDLLLQCQPIDSYHDWQQQHEQRCHATALHIARLCHAEGQETISILARILACASMIEQLHYLHRLIAAGRQPLPAHLLHQHGITLQTLTEQAADERCSRLLRQLLQWVEKDLRADKYTLVNRDDTHLIFARVLCCSLLSQLAAYLASDKNIMQQHIVLSPLHKLWIAWRNT